MSTPLSLRVVADPALIALDQALGSGRVITDRDVLETYSHDESEVPHSLPAAVVRVRDADDVAHVMRIASEHDIPVTPRAGGTGRTGGAVPVQGGIVLAFENMTRIKGVERNDLIAVVEPGMNTGRLHEVVEAEQLFYPPDPNSLGACCIGGNIAENAGGPRALRYGSTRDYVLGLEVVTADGTILKLGKRTSKGVTGYDLTSLIVGSEGTLAIITEATLKLLPKPEAIATLLVFLPDLVTAGRAVSAAFREGVMPRCVEMLDHNTLELIRPSSPVAIPDGARAMLLIEIDGPSVSLEPMLERMGNALDGAGALQVLAARHSGEREQLWAARRELSHALRRTARFKLAEDVVVPRSKIPDLIDVCQRIAERESITMPSYGHAGDGNIHVNLLWNDEAQKPAVDRAILSLFEAVVGFGGTLTGEHGIGVLKAPYLHLEQSKDLIAWQRKIKDMFDPRGILNPGKIFVRDNGQHGAC